LPYTAAALADYRLHYLNHEIELPRGEFAIGRGSKCQMIISDPQVSRRHAVLHVGVDQVLVEDLGSRNATLVNGIVVKGKVGLIGGDRLQIGRHEITIVRCKLEDTRDDVPTDGRAPAPWFHKAQLEAAARTTPAPRTFAEESTAPSSLLADLAQKALTAGNIEEAEWILGKILAEFHYRVSGGDRPSSEQFDLVMSHALRLAQLSGKTVFLEGLFEVLGAAGHVLTADAVSEIEALARKIPALAKGRLPKYVDALHARGTTDADLRVLLRLEALCIS